MWNPKCGAVFVFSLSSVFLFSAAEVSHLSQNSISSLSLQSNNENLNNIVAAPKKDPDAIFYPDEFLKDSYGNPITTPFTPPARIDVADDIGFMTDVNKHDEKPNESDSRGAFSEVKKDPLGFVLPSYASGITKIETLNPNAPKFPLVPPTRPPTNQQIIPQIQPNQPQNPQQNYPIPPNNILPPFSSNDNRKPLNQPLNPVQIPQQTYQIPPNKILPPFSPTDVRKPYPHLEINTQPTLVYVTTAGSLNYNTLPPVNVKPPTTTTRRPQTPLIQNPVINNNQNVPNTQNNDDGVYRGGFGGAPGILGDQHTPGYAVKPKPGEAAPAARPPVPPPSPPSSAILPPNNRPQQTLQAPFQQPAFVPAPPQHQHNPPVQNQNTQFKPPVNQLSPPIPAVPAAPVAPPTQKPSPPIGGGGGGLGVYSGSFGGPPGVLSPYDNLGKKI